MRQETRREKSYESNRIHRAPPHKSKEVRGPVVTDHALVRWLERVYELDVDALRERILTDKVKTALKTGAHRAIIDGLEYGFSDGRITTIRRVIGP